MTTNSNFNGSVTLGVSGLPTGTSASFTPSSLSATGSSTLTVQTVSNTIGGAYPLTITGTNGTNLVIVNASLVIVGVGASPGNFSSCGLLNNGTGTNWSTSVNWTNITAGGFGPPGVSNALVFTNWGTTTVRGSPDNFLDSSVAVASLVYSHTNNFHTTLITPGGTLTIATNLAVGTGTDLGTNETVYATITGPTGASLMVTNTNCLINIRQGTGTNSGPYSQRATLDLSGLDTLSLQAARLLLAADGSAVSREVGNLYLAGTNTITVFGTAPAIDISENPSNGTGSGNDPTPLTSYLYLGQSNALFADSLAVGRSKGAGMLTFNPVFLPSNPMLYLRGATASRVNTFSVGDQSALGSSNQRCVLAPWT